MSHSLRNHFVFPICVAAYSCTHKPAETYNYSLNQETKSKRCYLKGRAAKRNIYMVYVLEIWWVWIHTPQTNWHDATRPILINLQKLCTDWYQSLESAFNQSELHHETLQMLEFWDHIKDFTLGFVYYGNERSTLPLSRTPTFSCKPQCLHQHADNKITRHDKLGRLVVHRSHQLRIFKLWVMLLCVCTQCCRVLRGSLIEKYFWTCCTIKTNGQLLPTLSIAEFGCTEDVVCQSAHNHSQSKCYIQKFI